MGEMASTLAHELNQPLAAIANYLQGSRRLLRESPDQRAPQILDALDKAAEQAVRAGDVIQRLRDFVARGETERRIESLKKLIEEASALALVAAREKSVRVSFQLDPALDLVLVDKVQIQQVLLNLLRNALESKKRDPPTTIPTSKRCTQNVSVDSSTINRGHAGRKRCSYSGMGTVIAIPPDPYGE